jgi:hypothetical protein
MITLPHDIKSVECVEMTMHKPDFDSLCNQQEGTDSSSGTFLVHVYDHDTLYLLVASVLKSHKWYAAKEDGMKMVTAQFICSEIQEVPHDVKSSWGRLGQAGQLKMWT